MTLAFQIRPAALDDADAIAAVHIDARRQGLPYLPEMHTDEETRAWVAEVVLPNQTVLVAEIDGRVAGMIAWTDGWVEHLYIAPDAQGRGLGDALLTLAKVANPAGLTLWTFQRNERARAFYERRGFRAVEFTDGAGNEEREPDVRYAWRT